MGGSNPDFALNRKMQVSFNRIKSVIGFSYVLSKICPKSVGIEFGCLQY